MKRLILITAALAAVMAGPGSRAVCAQELHAKSELLEVLSGVKKGESIRFHTVNEGKHKRGRFRRLRGDTVVLRRGFDLNYAHAGDIDSLWIRTGGHSGLVGLLVGGGIGATIGAVTSFIIYDHIVHSWSWGDHTSKPGPAMGIGAAVGFVVGGIPGFFITHRSGEWEQRYPTKQPEESALGRDSAGLRLGLMPDLKTGVRVAAAYSF